MCFCPGARKGLSPPLDEIQKKIDRIQAAQQESQYQEAWKVINEISDRRKAKEGQIPGTSPEERMSTWYTHFKKLFEDKQENNVNQEEISNIFTEVEI